MKRLLLSIVIIGLIVAEIQGEAFGGQPYVAAIGDDASFDPFNISVEDSQWLNVNTKYACEIFDASKPINQQDPCFDPVSSARIGAGNSGHYSWDIVLPVKPAGDFNISFQCTILKPNEIDVWDCSGETGEVVGPSCTRAESTLKRGALPEIEALAYPGPFAEPGFISPFHLTAMRNPGKYGYFAYDRNTKWHQVLDGTEDSRIALKACFTETIFVALPENGSLNALGETESNLNEGDVISVTMTVNAKNTVDIYCSSESIRINGIGESQSLLEDYILQDEVCTLDIGQDGIYDTIDDMLICDGCPEPVTIYPNVPPTSSPDNYITLMDIRILRYTTDPDDLCDNDDLGSPEAVITSFGGGSLGGSVTDYAAGSTLNLGPGSSLTVNADGSFDFTPPAGSIGIFAFEYRLSNGYMPDSDTWVIIAIEQEPAAVPDNYTILPDSQISRQAADPDDLLDNDVPGSPEAPITSFGGGSLGGTVTDHAAGTTIILVPGGLLTVNADGSFDFTPPLGFTGDYTFDYRLTNVHNSSVATVTISVGESPATVDDTYVTLMNTQIARVAADPDDLLDNDSAGLPSGSLVSFGGGSLGGAVTDRAAGTIVTPLPTFADGSLTAMADGGFTFLPPTGFTGIYSFEYRLQNMVGFSDATVTIDVQ